MHDKTSKCKDYRAFYQWKRSHLLARSATAESSTPLLNSVVKYSNFPCCDRPLFQDDVDRWVAAVRLRRRCFLCDKQ